MTPEFITVTETATVVQTVEKIRKLSEELESVHYVYTVDDEGALTGALSLRSLVLAAPDEEVSGLVSRDLITVSPDADQEEVAETISKYDLLAVPVVDENDKLLGIVTIDDALDVMEEEHDEDLQIAGAAGMRDDAGGALLPLLRWILRRSMWFIVWVALALLTVMAGGFGLFAGALVLAPIILLLADNAVALSINDLLDYDGKRKATEHGHGSQAILGLLMRNIGLAMALAIIGFVVLFGLQGALGSEQAGAFGEAVGYLVNAGLPAVIVCALIMVASVLVTLYGRARLDRDRDISNTAITLLAMLLSLAAYFGLTVAFLQLGLVLV